MGSLFWAGYSKQKFSCQKLSIAKFRVFCNFFWGKSQTSVLAWTVCAPLALCKFDHLPFYKLLIACRGVLFLLQMYLVTARASIIAPESALPWAGLIWQSQNTDGWWMTLQAAQCRVSPWGKKKPFIYGSRKCWLGQNLQKLPWNTGWEAQHLIEILTPWSWWIWKSLLVISTRFPRWGWGWEQSRKSSKVAC